jgi:hypothetical protein
VNRGVYRALVWKPEEKRPLRRHRHRWENKIEVNLNLDGKGWTGSGEGIVASYFVQSKEGLDSIEYVEFLV